MGVTIVENDPDMCLRCHSRLQGGLCYNCNIRYMSLDVYMNNPDGIEVQNPEECIKIARKKLRRLEKEKRELKQSAKSKSYAQGTAKFIEDNLEELDSEISVLKNLPLSSLISQKSDTTVFIYFRLTNKCMREKHPIIPVTATTVDLKTGKKMEVNVYYCKKCNKNFINYEALRHEFHNKNLYPLFHFENGDSLAEFREISELRMYGYNVQEGGLSSSERQAILARIIDNNLMTKAAIIKQLQFLIGFNGKNSSHAFAKRKWEEDLKFVSHYTKNNKRAIKAKFTR